APTSCGRWVRGGRPIVPSRRGTCGARAGILRAAGNGYRVQPWAPSALNRREGKARFSAKQSCLITVLAPGDRVFLAADHLNLADEIPACGAGHEQRAERGATPPIDVDNHYTMRRQVEVVEGADPRGLESVGIVAVEHGCSIEIMVLIHRVEALGFADPCTLADRL